MDVNSNASMPNAAQYLESLKQAYEGAVGAGGRKFIYLTPEGFKAMSRSEALLSFVQTGGKVTTVSHAMLSSIVEAASKSESSGLPEHFAQNVSRLASSSDAFSSRRAHQKFQTVFSSLTQELSTAKKPEAASTLVSPLRADGKQAAAKCAEWEVNFGLLYSAHENTDDPEMKSTIRFLMANYLAKAAFLNAEVAHDSLTVRQEYEDMAQVGQFNFGGQYHRGIDAQIPLLRMVGLEGKIGSKERGHDVIPMDSMEIQDLFRVGFVTTPGLDQRGAIVELLVAQFEAHLDSFPDNMEFPVLIDITEQIGQSLITNGDPEKIQEYQAKQKEARDQINSIVKEAADIVRKRHPDNEKVQTQAADYLKSNLAVVSRAKAGESLAVLGLHPGMFGPDDFEQKPTGKFDAPPSHLRNEFLRRHAKEWAGHTAINIGAVNFRRVAANASCDPAALSQLGGGRAVQYAVPGKVDVVMYPTLSEIVDTNAFNLLIAMAEGKGGAGSAEALLAKATVMMMARLIDKIGDAQWKQKQNDPAVRELLQTTLFRTMQHLATAVNSKGDFRQFTQSIDRVHTELTSLLAIFSPFDPATFPETYRKFLEPNFPPSVKPAAVGLARSAMNVFGGVNAAVLKNNPNPVRVCGAHSYYEEAAVVGGTRTLDQALNDPAVEKVDLYVAEFNHNIDIDPNHTNYQKGSVIQDIRNIFEKKPNTDQLTVAIDATIDFTNSDDMKELFSAFATEIQEGKLNIVVFRSGQKFDMLGLDNYFGSPFYAVNNGDKKWADFNNIATEEVFHTDALSQQYFSWMAETGPQLAEEYKGHIFNNARAILDVVPPGLKPGVHDGVCVCTFENDVKTPFIDIKLKLPEPQNYEMRKWISNRFKELFINEGKFLYERGSFGFAHPNITWIDPKFRINPGIDADDIRIFAQFLQEFEAKVNELTTSA